MVHLHVHSTFSFLDGASSIRDLVDAAANRGMSALALTDHSNVCGAVEFHKCALAAGIKPIQGVEVCLEGGGHLVLLANGPRGYSNICRLLTVAHLGSPRGFPIVRFGDLELHGKDVFALSGCRKGEIPRLILQGRFDRALETARRYASIFGKGNFFLELHCNLLPGDLRLNRRLKELGEHLGLGLVATCNVHYERKERFYIHELLSCARTGTSLDEVHPERRLNAEHYLKSEGEMARALRGYPEALLKAEEIASRCEPALDLSAKQGPRFPLPRGESPGGYLRKMAHKGARERYGEVTPEILDRIEHELDVITRLGYENYFLLAWDLVRYARERGIRCSGRGSAADSAVAYCLYITDVDAVGRGLLFERFMSLERAEKPDIDVDFDARYRDMVADYVYSKYGRDNVAGVCTYNTFRARSALRELGKVMGFAPAELDRIAKRVPYYHADALGKALEEAPELKALGVPRPKLERLIEAVESVRGFPRHIGTHLGGLAISGRPIIELSPLQRSAKGAVICQFDKEYVEDIGLVKLDLLSLRMLSAIEDTLRACSGVDYERIPYDDRATYRMLNRGDTVGVFQLESPAQRALQARLGASNLEDVVASVALIRPGPIKGNMVEPFIARRLGREPVTYLHPQLRPILEKTYGVVLFQEQVIEMASVIAGFSQGEADRLRRVMSHARSPGEMEAIGRNFVDRAVQRGVPEGVASAIFSCMRGYASYGFCEAHAAAFGNIAYSTAYLLRHYPAEFYAAVLSNQPMGYYSPNTICNEARRRGIRILPPDINLSGRGFEARGKAIRVPLGQLKGMREGALGHILAEREKGPFSSFFDFLSRCGSVVERDIIEGLILCGAFDSLESNRRRLLWQLQANDPSLTLDLPDFSREEKFWKEYELLGIMVRGHIMGFLREHLRVKGYRDSSEIREARDGERVTLAGVPIRPHRPPTRSGRRVVFLSLEDEKGLAEITAFETIYERYGHLIFAHPAIPLEVTGYVTRRGRVSSVTATHICAFDLEGY